MTVTLPSGLPNEQHTLHVALWEGYDSTTGLMIGTGANNEPYARDEEPSFIVSESTTADPYGIAAYDKGGLFVHIPDEEKKNLTDLANMLPRKLTDFKNNDAELTGTSSRVVVTFHGWNRTGESSGYTGSMDSLANNLKQTLPDGWSFVRYDWPHDAATGNLFGRSQAQQRGNLIADITYLLGRLALEVVAENAEYNAMQSACHAYQHGMVVGYKLVNQVGADNLKCVHLIAHSAGSWAAWSAMRYIRAVSPNTEVQVTYLDPFIPSQAVTWTTIDQYFATSQLQLTPSYIAPHVTSGTFKAEGFYANDESELWIGDATSIGWSWSPPDGDVWRTDLTPYGIAKWDTHSGPIQFYADTVANPALFEAEGHGYVHSLAYNTKVIRIENLDGALAFGDVQVGTNPSPTKRFRIHNDGAQSLNIGFISSPSSAFALSWTSGAITKGSYQDVTVTFTPSAVQTYSGSIRINSDATGDSAVNVDVSGNGTSTPTYRLDVCSSGVPGVVIDSTTVHGGTTDYFKSIVSGANVSLTAPQYVGAGTARKRFSSWSGSGSGFAATSGNQTISSTMSANATVMANYVDDPVADITPPILTITSPANNATVTSANLSVSGTASDAGLGDNGVSVTVNGVPATNGTASGANTANWSSSVTLSAGVNTITVVAKDTFNNSVQQQIIVTCNPPDITPIITSQPAPHTDVTVGQAVMFTAAASGTPTPTYKWQVSTNSGSTWTDISGATSATYSFTAALGDNGKKFRCVATNAAGTATSGAAALTVTLATVATPTFTPPTGTYTTAQTVTIASATPGATIHYTTNGGTPTDTSPTYSTPVNVSTSMTLKALALAANMYNSDIASATYAITGTGGWVVDNGDFNIESSTLSETKKGADYSASCHALFSTRIVSFQVDFVNPPQGGRGEHQMSFWITDDMPLESANGYMVILYWDSVNWGAPTDYINLIRVDNGNWNVIASQALSPVVRDSSTHRIKLTVDKGEVWADLDGEKKITATDASYSMLRRVAINSYMKYYSIDAQFSNICVTNDPYNASGWRYPHADMAMHACAAEHTTTAVDSGTLTEKFEIDGLTGNILSGDVDGDGRRELVTVVGSELRIYRGDGTLKRTITLPRNECFAAMLEDVDGDGILDIGLGGRTAGFTAYFYKGDGTQLKAFAGIHGGNWDEWVSPIGISGSKVLMGYNAGYAGTPRGIAAFDYATGVESWYYQIGPACGIYSVADMDGDGKLEITMNAATVHNGISGNGTTDGDLYLVVVDETGSAKLSQIYPTPSNGAVTHVFADLEGNGTCEILGFESHDPTYSGVSQIHIYNTSGVEQHTFDGPSNANWTFAVGNVIGDAALEIVATNTADETTYVLDRNLGVLSQKSSVGYVQLLCDLTGDGIPEIVTLSNSGLLRVLDSQLNVLCQIQAGDQLGTVIVSDVDGDGIVEIICRIGSNVHVYAFSPNITPPSITSLTPTHSAATGGNSVTITGTNLANATVVKFGTATAVITANSATQITATAPAGTAGATVDVTVTTAGGTSTANAATKYNYTESVTVQGNCMWNRYAYFSWQNIKHVYQPDTTNAVIDTWKVDDNGNGDPRDDENRILLNGKTNLANGLIFAGGGLNAYDSGWTAHAYADANGNGIVEFSKASTSTTATVKYTLTANSGELFGELTMQAVNATQGYWRVVMINDVYVNNTPGQMLLYDKCILNGATLTARSTPLAATTAEGIDFLKTSNATTGVAAIVSATKGWNLAFELTETPHPCDLYARVTMASSYGGWGFDRAAEVQFTLPAGEAVTLKGCFKPTLTARPIITSQPTAHTDVTAGQAVMFTAAASGTPTPTYKWQVSTNSGSTWTDISGATSATYSFTATIGDNGKQYRCMATNSVTFATSNAATLAVTTATPVINSILPMHGPADGGNSVTITGTNFGSSPPLVNFATATAVVAANSATQITVTVPAGTAGTMVDVTVTTASGTSAARAKSKYTYDTTNDDFESYALNTWPSRWSADANASDVANNKIVADPANAANKVMRMYGALGSYWGALGYLPCPIPDDFTLDVRVYNGTEVIPASGHQYRCVVGLRQGTSWNNYARTLLVFDKTGNALRLDNTVIGQYALGTWHQVRLQYHRTATTITVDYWINGVAAGSASETLANVAGENSLDHIELQVSAGSGYFDDVALAVGYAVWNIQLTKGWNLISLPLEPVTPGVVELFGNKIIGAIWRWDAGKTKYQPVPELKALEGFWVYAPQATTVMTYGVPPASTQINLVPGWNLVGPSADVTPSLPGAYFWGWHPGKYGHFIIESQPKAGCGYWIYVWEATTWDAATGAEVRGN